MLDGSNVDIRHFAAPELRILDGTLLDDIAFFVNDFEFADFVIIGKPGFHDKILGRFFMLGNEVDRAENSAKTPEVLIFEIGSIAMLVNFDFKRIFAEPLQIRRQIEFRRQAAVFGISDLFAVYPHVKSGRNAIEMDDRAAKPPTPRTLERGLV